MEGIGESIGAAFTVLLAVIVIQIPFAVLGVWVSGCWLFSFIQQHWH